MKHSVVFLAAFAALVSCQKGGLETFAPEVINLSGTVVNTKASGLDLQRTEIVSGSAVGVSIAEVADPAAVYNTAHANLRYTAGASGALTSVEAQVWPSDGSNVDITAYAPHANGVSGSLAFSVKDDQRTDADYLASDLIYARKENVAKTKETVNLEFNHMLAKANVELVPTANLPADQLLGAKVTLLGMQTNAVLNLADGTLEPVETPETSDIAVTVVTATDEICGAAIVAPQTVAAGSDLVKVVLASGKVFVFAAPKAISFQSGKETSLSVTLSNAKLTVASTLNDWGNGGNNALVESDEFEVDPDAGTEDGPEIVPPTYEGEHVYVDLGLPSGVKWATMDIGAASDTEYGALFAWGETAPKTEFTKYNYALWNGQHIVTDEMEYDIDSWVDVGNDISGTQYDAARVNWGGSWRMPTIDNLRELTENCSFVACKKNGKWGVLVTGKNNNSVFFLHDNYYYRYQSDLYSDDQAWLCHATADSNNNWIFGYGYAGKRFEGRYIRPVCD